MAFKYLTRDVLAGFDKYKVSMIFPAVVLIQLGFVSVYKLRLIMRMVIDARLPTSPSAIDPRR